MKWIANPSSKRSKRFEIVYAPPVGYYLYVYEGEKCIRDDLQDTLEFAMEVAYEDYGVDPKEWKQVGET